MPEGDKQGTAGVLEGRTCLVTGANGGIGYEVALGLARQGGRVLLLCRDATRGQAALEALRAAVPTAEAELVLVDMGLLADVRRVGRALAARLEHLDVLVLNAGIYPRERRTTPEGLEETLAINHLGPFLLVQELLPVLKRSGPARVVVVASDAHRWADLDLDDLQFERRRFNRHRVYGTSKMLNILFTFELARRLAGTEVTATCLHPGAVATNLVFLTDWLKPLAGLIRLVLRSPAQGAALPLYLATDPAVAGITGRYFVGRRPRDSCPLTQDSDAARRLWERSEALIREAEARSGGAPPP